MEKSCILEIENSTFFFFHYLKSWLNQIQLFQNFTPKTGITDGALNETNHI